MFNKKSWKRVTVRLGCELKTAQQLNALGIKNELQIRNVTVNGIKQIQLVEDCCIKVFVDYEDEQKVKTLPFVMDIE